MIKQLRHRHRMLAPWLLIPLLLVALTGMTYRLGRAWLGWEKESAGWLIDIHAGEWLGTWGSLFFVILVGGTTLFFLVSGAAMLWQMREHPTTGRWPRRPHRLLALFALLPLTATVLSGLSCKIGATLFGMSDATFSLLMKIHQGSWLGPTLKPFYVLFLGCSVLFLAFSGLSIWRQRKAK